MPTVPEADDAFLDDMRELVRAVSKTVGEESYAPELRQVESTLVRLLALAKATHAESTERQGVLGRGLVDATEAMLSGVRELGVDAGRRDDANRMLISSIQSDVKRILERQDEYQAAIKQAAFHRHQEASNKRLEAMEIATARFKWTVGIVVFLGLLVISHWIWASQ